MAVSHRCWQDRHRLHPERQIDRLFLATDIERAAVHDVEENVSAGIWGGLQNANDLSGAAIPHADRFGIEPTLDPAGDRHGRSVGYGRERDTRDIGALRQNSGHEIFEPNRAVAVIGETELRVLAAFGDDLMSFVDNQSAEPGNEQWPHIRINASAFSIVAIRTVGCSPISQ